MPKGKHFLGDPHLPNGSLSFSHPARAQNRPKRAGLQGGAAVRAQNARKRAGLSLPEPARAQNRPKRAVFLLRRKLKRLKTAWEEGKNYLCCHLYRHYESVEIELQLGPDFA